MFRSSSKFQGRAKSKVRKKLRIFHATDFESLMKPCFTFCFILGIFPYNIHASTFEFSRSRYIVSSIVICIFCIYALVMFYELDIASAGNIKFDGVPDTLQGNCYYLLGFFITIITYIMTRPRMRLLQTILDISSRLPPDMFQKLSRLIHAKDIIGFFFLLGMLPKCCIFSTHFLEIMIKMITLYMTLLVFQMDMLYMNCVCVVRACFQRINDNLTNLRELLKNDEPHLLRRIYHEQKNPFLLMELKALKKQHLMVSDTLQLLNTIFSLQLLATIVMTFAEITFSLYFYIIQLRGNGVSIINLDKQIWYHYFITSIAYYSIKIALIVWSCETGKDRALEIGTTVHDVLISTSDKQIKDELQLFSLQILHRDNIFSAKGLTVDATLLTAIVGSITTYLLILIQFMVSDNCDGKQASNNTSKN